MANKLTIGGLGEWLELPRELRAAADPVIKRFADDARADVKAAYPRITGALQDGVVLVETPSGDPAITNYIVKSTAPHAAPYEWGSQVHGMRAHPTFLPITNRARHAATAAVIEIVRAAGFMVTGDTE
jgi:hypothetical protein